MEKIQAIILAEVSRYLGMVISLLLEQKKCRKWKSIRSCTNPRKSKWYMGTNRYESAGDQFGHSVALSAAGDVIAIGARNNAGTGQDAGHVRVFDMSDFVSSILHPKLIGFAIYPNPASTEVIIQLEEIDIFERATIYNSLGQRLVTSLNTILNTSNLSKGIDIIEVETSKGIASQKLIIEVV